MKGSSKTQTLDAARHFADFAQPVLVVCVVQPIFGESPVFRYRPGSLPDYGGRDEHRIEVPDRPCGVVCHGQGSAPGEEELGSRPACRQFRR
jgi:hypothetical protein